MSIKVFSKPACPGCFGTAHYLRKAGLEYDMIDITQDLEAAEYVASLGYKQTPVVVVSPDEHWSGLHIEKIMALAS